MQRGIDASDPLGPVLTLPSRLIGVFPVAVSGLVVGESVASGAPYRRCPSRVLVLRPVAPAGAPITRRG
ncbi:MULTISPECIES: hypothetical protein [unclassified Streptomyces]|uniref:hypothetical protein n=1 Tax=unclassified Streptomyces TaxID=2593676 RepID=UPI0024731605|nr:MULTISPECIES: hypothetical protein [unclassified Streptomyces]MDH6454651.1 hypothetical protein [Streptomyces sp. SAI-119]MDH6494791.1 hypothetical protein [Streptomyces sp. SAI-149]